MSYLVICPTCNCRMSVNAQTCPCCGEDQFFRYEEKTVRKEAKCDPDAFSDDYDRCANRGYFYKDSYSMCVSLNTYNSGHYLRMSDVNGVEVKVFENRVPAQLWERLKKNYRDSVIGKSFGSREVYRHIYTNSTVCPKCEGSGRVLVDEQEYVTIDIRKKV